MSSKNKRRRAVVAIYIDPDFYPPTINAVLNMAVEYEEVIVISRNNSVKDFPYPANVRLKKVGKFSSVREMETQPLWQKVLFFLLFSFNIIRYGAGRKCSLLLLYDAFALFAFYLGRWFFARTTVWYHNHDMPDKNAMSSYSIGGLAARYEEKGMRQIHCFSLPSKDRLQYYPRVAANIPVFILPNFPSLKVYGKRVASQRDDRILRIIFQGFVGAGHSLEELVQLLPATIGNRSLQLVIKGSVRDEYKTKLNLLATQLGVSHQLVWAGIGPYSELPALTRSCDVGIGINMNQDIVSKTQGTSSNKIYEYAASGLPVMLYDSEQFRRHLQQYEWAFFTNGSVESLQQELEKIVDGLPRFSELSRQAFERELNFEQHFTPALHRILALTI